MTDTPRRVRAKSVPAGECVSGLIYPPKARPLPKSHGARTLDGGALTLVRVYRTITPRRTHMGGIAGKDVSDD
jgi:hypothetical protein